MSSLFEVEQTSFGNSTDPNKKEYITADCVVVNQDVFVATVPSKPKEQLQHLDVHVPNTLTPKSYLYNMKRLYFRPSLDIDANPNYYDLTYIIII